MFDLPLSLYGLWLGLAAACGINSYAVVLTVGLLSRFGIAPASLELLGHPGFLAVAFVLYGIEFLVDKSRHPATVWDVLHAVIRPMMAAGVSFLALQECALLWRLSGAMMGGAFAFAVHGAKSSVRFAANARYRRGRTSAISLAEDALAVGTTWFAVVYPIFTLGLVGLGIVALALILHRIAFAFLKAAHRTLDAVISKSPSQ
ncbi:MAG: DUF4126 domain-containing protein [Candidatus Poribacteria bacterium]|nr:DUF4126 domain-containing protein [Candidatus Poribacteria bacterium]